MSAAARVEAEPASDPDAGDERLGSALRRAWIGYQQRLDEEMAAAGFAGPRFPNGRVLRLCSGGDAVSIADVGRHLGVSRQRAAQIVTGLRTQGYVTVTTSRSSAKEKVVRPTRRGTEYLAAQRKASAKIERSLRRRLGADDLAALRRVVDALAGDEDLRLRDYLRDMRPE